MDQREIVPLLKQGLHSRLINVQSDTPGKD